MELANVEFVLSVYDFLLILEFLNSMLVVINVIWLKNCFHDRMYVRVISLKLFDMDLLVHVRFSSQRQTNAFPC